MPEKHLFTPKSSIENTDSEINTQKLLLNTNIFFVSQKIACIFA